MARPLPFVLASTDHGAMIVNRLDLHRDERGEPFGVGAQLLSTGCFDPEEIALGIEILRDRRETHGDGVVAVDCGANVGTHALAWAREMTGWGEVVAFEPQERIYYALAGNLALANLFNARACWAAVGATSGKLMMPRPDYLRPGSYGSLELRHAEDAEFIGQVISYELTDLEPVMLVALDDLQLPRLDLLKIDVERMEVDVLTGARATIERCRPAILVEWIKTGLAPIAEFLTPLGYVLEVEGLNVVGTPT